MPERGSDARPDTGPGSNRLPDLAAAIKRTYAAFQGHVRRSVEDALRLGNLLSEAKELLGHGRFMGWVEQNCHVKHRRVNDFMRFAREVRECNIKLAQIANLSVGAALDAVQREANQRDGRRQGQEDLLSDQKWRAPTRDPLAREKREQRVNNREWQQRVSAKSGVQVLHLKRPQADQALRLKWFTETGEKHTYYIWRSTKNYAHTQYEADLFEYIHLCYTQHFLVAEGNHHYSMEPVRWLSAPPKWIPTDVEVEQETWDIGEVGTQILEEWRASLIIAEGEVHAAKRAADPEYNVHMRQKLMGNREESTSAAQASASATRASDEPTPARPRRENPYSDPAYAERRRAALEQRIADAKAHEEDTDG
jgi:hypothetical protein